MLSITMIADTGRDSFQSLGITDLRNTITGVGTYSLGLGLEDDGRGIGLVYLTNSGNPSSSLVSSSGSLEITRFEDDRISGTFSAELRDLSDEERAQVSGSFDATELRVVAL